MEEVPDLYRIRLTSIERAYSELKKIYDITPRRSIQKSEAGMPFIDCFWEVLVDVEVNGEVKEFPLMLSFENFPFELPSVYVDIKTNKELNGIPHFSRYSESLGQICTYDHSISKPNLENLTGTIHAVINKARKNIKDGLEETNTEDYEDELLAYWHSIGIEQPKIIEVLHTLNSSEIDTKELYLYKLEKPVNGFQYFVCEDNDVGRKLKDYFQGKTTLTRRDIVYAGEVGSPDFTKMNTNKDVLDYLVKEKPDTKFIIERGINSSQNPTLLFSKTVKDKLYFFAWTYKIYKMPKEKFYGFRKNKVTNYQIMKLPNFQGNCQPTRMELFPFTRQQWGERNLNVEERVGATKVVIAGLGSIGSNLIPFLKPLPINKYLLIDPDNLKLENLSRHFLGIGDANKNKAEAIKRYLLNVNPLLEVVTLQDSYLGDVASRDYKLINAYDIIVVCIGETNTELYVDSMLKAKIITKPVLFIWVEPHLAGGHCLFITPNTKTKFEELHADNYYKYNIIAKTEYEGKNFNKREVGCQTSYIPYSLSSVVTFLSAIYPYIIKIFNGSDKESKAITWVGDKDILSKSGIVLSSDSKDLISGNVYINGLE